MTFKEGDRIVVTKGSLSVPTGITGTVRNYIEDYFGNGPKVLVDMDGGRGRYRCNPRCIELVRERKFKSGDRVVVVPNDAIESGLYGAHGTVELNGDEPCELYRVRLDDEEGTWWLGEDELEREQEDCKGHLDISTGEYNEIPGFIRIKWGKDEKYIAIRNISYIAGFEDTIDRELVKSTKIVMNSGDAISLPLPVGEFAGIIEEAINE